MVDISVSGVIIGITGLHAVHKCTVIIRVSLGMDLAEKKWGIVQGVVFTDQAKEALTINDIFKSKDEICHGKA